MNRFEIITIAISLLITAIFSCLVGFAGASLYGPFWSWFTLSFLIQVVVFVVWNSYLIQKDNQLAARAEFETMKTNPTIGARLTCAYCNQSNDVQVQLNKKNTFKCVSCNQVSGIVIQLTSTTLTTPMDSVKLPISQTETAEIKFVN